MGGGASTSAADANKALTAASMTDITAALAELSAADRERLKEAVSKADAGKAVAKKIKLQYANARGISETTRCMFAIGKVEYEDARYDMPFDKDAAYQAAKSSGELDATGGDPGIPFLEVDGVRTGGFFPIYRMAARLAGLMGASDIEAAQIDMLTEKLRDIRNDWLDLKKDEEKAKTFIEETYSDALQKLEKQVPAASSGPFLVGAKVSFADVYLWRFIKDGAISLPDEAVQAAYAKLPPKLKASVDETGKIPELLVWLEKRPKTDF